jgi:cyclase
LQFAIEFPLRYLRELDGAVRAAIDAGRSVQATLEVAAMPCYSAYSLFEWAHNTINVPAAYRGLQDTATVELSGQSTHERI